MSKTAPVKPAKHTLTSVPAFWPMAMAASMFEAGTDMLAKNVKFVEEEIKIHDRIAARAGNAEPGAARSAHHEAARIRQAGRAGRRWSWRRTPAIPP